MPTTPTSRCCGPSLGSVWCSRSRSPPRSARSERFASPEKLTGYTGFCPRVVQSGERDRRGPLSKHGSTYLRWALLEATMHALKHPAYRVRYQRNKKRLGRQRGAKVARDAALYRPPPERTGKRGRPRSKGERLPSLRELPDAPKATWREAEVTRHAKTASVRCVFAGSRSRLLMSSTSWPGQRASSPLSGFSPSKHPAAFAAPA